MPRISVLPGERFEYYGKVFEIQRYLSNEQILTKDLSFGQDRTFSRLEIAKNLIEGNLRFSVTGKNRKKVNDQGAYYSYQYGDLSRIDERYNKVAKTRYKIIEPLLHVKRSMGIIKERIQEVSREAWVGEAFSKSKYTLSPATVYRWIKDYEESGKDIRSLIPSYCSCGNKGKEKINSEVNDIISKAISTVYLSDQRRTIQDVWQEVSDMISRENEFREPNDKLYEPSYNTIKARIDSLGPYDVTRSRFGKRYADKLYGGTVAGRPSQISRPLEMVQIDHTKLDLFVVDEKDNLPIGRPYFTFCVDAATKYPLGFYLGFDPPSYRTVMECLYHSIIVKDYVQENFKKVKNKWESWGLPETIRVDNGKEFIGRDLEDTCFQLGIKIERCPPGRPQWKAFIERYFGIINRRLLHNLPGTTFSRVLDRDIDYNPKKNAVITLGLLEELIHILLVDYMPYRPMKSKGGKTPIEIWRDGILEYPPSLPNSNQELWALVGSIEKREISNRGIQFMELPYTSSELVELRMKLKSKEKVTFKYHENDLSRIYVWDRFDERYILVLANDQEYTKNLSLWKHKIILKNVRKKVKEVNQNILREVRKTIEETVELAWPQSKRTKSRETMARFKSIEGKTTELLKQEVDFSALSWETDNSEIAEHLGIEFQSENMSSSSKKSKHLRLINKDEEKKREDSINLDGWS